MVKNGADEKARETALASHLSSEEVLVIQSNAPSLPLAQKKEKALWHENPLKNNTDSNVPDAKSHVVVPLEIEVNQNGGQGTVTILTKVYLWLPPFFVVASFALLVVVGNLVYSCDEALSPASSWLYAYSYLGCVSVIFYGISINSNPVLQNSKSMKLKLYLICLFCPVAFLPFRIGIEDTKPKGADCFADAEGPNFGVCKRLNETSFKNERMNWLKRCGFDSYEEVFVYKPYYTYWESQFDILESALDLLKIRCGGIETCFNPGGSQFLSNEDFNELVCKVVFVPCDSHCTVTIPGADIMKLPQRNDEYCESILEDYIEKLDVSDLDAWGKSKDYLREILSVPCGNNFNETFRKKALFPESYVVENDAEAYKDAFKGSRESLDATCAAKRFEDALKNERAKSEKRTEAVSLWKKRYFIGMSFGHAILFFAGVALASTKQVQRKGMPHAFWARHSSVSLAICFCLVLMSACSLVIALGMLQRFNHPQTPVYMISTIAILQFSFVIDRLFITHRFRGDNPESQQTDKRKKGKRTIFNMLRSKLYKYRSWYRNNFSVGGKHFLLAAIVKEIIEIGIQGVALFSSGKDDDVSLLLAGTSLFLANCISAPVFYIKRLPTAIVIADSSFDLSYVILNTVRLFRRNESFRGLDVISVCFPLYSIAQLLGDYARFIISGKVTQCDEQKQTRRTSSLIRLPSAARYGEKSLAKKVYRLLVTLLLISCLCFGGISTFAIIKASSMHTECAEKFGQCMWQNSWPRKYLNDGVFEQPACNAHLLERIDATSCSKREIEAYFDGSTFQSLRDVYGISGVLPKSLLRVMAEESSQIRTFEIVEFPGALDFSSIGLGSMRLSQNFTKVLKQAQDVSIVSINIRNNSMNAGAIVSFVDALCRRDDGTISLACKSTTRIDMSWNKALVLPLVFTEELAVQLPHLTWLNVVGNPFISDSNLLQDVSFQDDRFIFSSQDLGDSSLNALAYVASHLPLKAPKIAQLDLSYLNAGSRGAAIIRAMLEGYPDLTHLYIRKSGFNSKLTQMDTLWKLTSLQVLDLSYNNLAGSIPSQIGKLSQLINLDLGFNDRISGTIPLQLFELSKLNQLHLHSNSLWGYIPSAIGKLAHLTKVRFDENKLIGTIPTTIGTLSALDLLDFSDNALHGKIPIEMGLLRHLTRLNLATNQLRGTIPLQLTKLTDLAFLTLRKNKITGTIPTQVGEMTRLTYLSIASNDLSGRIPSQLGKLTHLKYLFAGGNNLENKTIPYELATLDANININ